MIERGANGAVTASERDPDSGRLLGEEVIRVTDLGPEPPWHKDRARFGPWYRFEAELAAYPLVRERGGSPWEAVSRLVAMHRGLLERRWSAWP